MPLCLLRPTPYAGYGFRAFGNLLEEAQARGLLEFGRDEKSGAYVYRSSLAAQSVAAVVEAPPATVQTEPVAIPTPDEASEKPTPRRKPRGDRKPKESRIEEESVATDVPPAPPVEAPSIPVPDETKPEKKPARNRRPRKPKASAETS